MSSYFTLMLDTTPPILEVKSLNYAISGQLINFIITTNEPIGGVVELYSIDNDGVRRDHVFSIQDTELVGIIQDNFPIGVLTLYVRVIDEVGNISDLYYKTIRIYSEIGTMNVVTSIHTTKTIMSIKTNQVKTKISARLATNMVLCKKVECSIIVG